MTININSHNVAKAVVNHAIEMAIRGGTTVIIFGMEYDNQGVKEVRHLVSTAAEWESCTNKDELTFVTAIDKDGNYID